MPKTKKLSNYRDYSKHMEGGGKKFLLSPKDLPYMMVTLSNVLLRKEISISRKAKMV